MVSLHRRSAMPAGPSRRRSHVSFLLLLASMLGACQTVAPADPAPGPGAGPPSAQGEPGPAGWDGFLPRLFGAGDGMLAPSRVGSFAPRSWYAGASFGNSRIGTSASSVEGELAGKGYTTGVDLDDSDLGWRFFGGYRFAPPLALELSYIDQGTLKSTVGPEPASGVPQFLDDVADAHPALGTGPGLALRALVVGNDSLALSARGGLWWWQSDVRVKSVSQTLSVDRSGVDPFYGVDLVWYATSWGALRVDLARHNLDGDHATTLAVGFELLLDSLVR